MIVITIFQGIVFTTYLTFIIVKFGVLDSISDSWYKLKDLGGVWYSLFTWFCVLIGFPMFFQTNDTYPYLFFLSGAGLTAVGVATQFKALDKITPAIHFVGAMTGIAFALLGIWLERGSWLPILMFAMTSSGLILFKIKNLMWWIEITAFVMIIIGLLIK